MKQILLLFSLVLFSALSFGQSSIGDRLALQAPDLDSRANITIYPNPATTHIGLSESLGIERVVVFNMVGRQMKSFEVAEGDNRYFVGDLPRGMYLVQLVGQNNEIVTTKRVSKR